jgi:nucleotide-binding universal stress UspA family protein
LEPNTPKLILVPTDFSAPSAQALGYGVALAERFSAHLLVIYADTFVPPVDFTISAAGVFDLPREELVETAREQLQTFAETNISRSVPYDVRVLVGTPVDAILAQASETGADLIVMGTHGRTGLRRLLVGSVTEAVMRLAPVPVIVVHEESRLDAAAMRRIVSVPRSTAEATMAVSLAGVFADAEGAQYLEVPEGAGAAEIARAGDVDLIVLGIADDRSIADSLRGTIAERIVQHSVCPALTVNRRAVARATGVSREHEPALSA